MSTNGPRLFRLPTCGLLALAICWVIGCGRIPEPVSYPGETMGTTYVVKIAEPPSPFDVISVKDSTDLLLESINDQMSTWRPDSELSRFNDSMSTDWVPVSPELAYVVTAALKVSEATEGAFDVTVDPLIALWGFDAEGRPKSIPTDEEIAAVLERCGYKKLQARLDPPALRKSQPDLSVNLSAIAKGYGVDAVTEQLLDAGYENVMVEIGGEIRTRGQRGGGQPWHIGIEKPHIGTQREPVRAIFPGDRGMATSGNYRNFFELNGKIFSHTIDPSTGRPVESKLASATVLADDCMTADAWATAMMVLGPERGLALAEQQGLPVLLIVHDGNGNFNELATPAFEEIMAAAKTDRTETSGVALFVAALVIFAVALIGMSVGVIISNRRIKGSCGGLNNFKDDVGNSICEACTTPPEECDRVRAAAAESGMVTQPPAGADKTE